ncbi:hypothetical protein N9878_02260 [bacterium]|nr:hypothetical protein [bacterium]
MKDLHDYTDLEHDKAMARIMADLSRIPTPAPHKRTGPGLSFALAALMLILAVVVLMSAGCSTVAGAARGFADDTDATRRGLAEHFNEE